MNEFLNMRMCFIATTGHTAPLWLLQRSCLIDFFNMFFVSFFHKLGFHTGFNDLNKMNPMVRFYLVPNDSNFFFLLFNRVL